MSLYVCNADHEEIVHKGTHCPLCGTLSSIEDLKRTDANLRQQIGELEEQLEEARMDAKRSKTIEKGLAGVPEA